MGKKEAYERLVTQGVAEIVKEEELAKACRKEEPKAYIGFEPSGLAHVAWLMMVDKVNDLTANGFKVDILLADWHAFINDKLDRDIENIRCCGAYMEDCFLAMGLDEENCRIVYASEYIGDRGYWELVMRIGKAASLTRVKRALTIMGRKEDEAELDSSKVIYPLMQVADIFYLQVDVALGGMDQRKAHMLARDVAPKLKVPPPVALHTPLNAGLKGGDRMDPSEAKMSKSKPDSAIFLHDGPDEVERKVAKAYCPQGEVDGNPIMDITRNILFPRLGTLKVERPEKFGGDVEFDSYKALEKEYRAGKLHPADLKKAAVAGLNQVLDPIHKYFKRKPENLEAMLKLKKKINR